MPYLIDGHNVIAAMEGIDLDDPNDEVKLVLKLRAWSARINRRVILVFDGGIPGGPSRTLSTRDVQVIFAARQYTIADRIIRERIRKLPDAPNWTVVSSDHEILDEAVGAGAKTLTAQDFASAVERPPAADKEKPETVSASEVQDWLKIFGEPEPVPTPPPVAWTTSPATPPKKNPAHKPVRPKKQSGSGNRARRNTVSIGEQMGLEVNVPPESQDSGDKPEEISDREVDAWLQVFHDDPDSKIPPPNLRKPKRRKHSTKPKEPAVRKTEGLAADEVDSWLTIFSEPTGEAGTAPKPAAPQPKDSSKASPETSGPRSKLAEHRNKYARAEDQGKADLSEEDLELWHRLFGEEA